MKATPVQLKKLLDLQSLDSQVAKIKLTASSLPIHAQITDLMESRTHIDDDLIAATTEVSDLSVAAERSEADVVPVRERLARYEEKVEAAEMDPKALQSAIEEVAHLKQRISDLEDVELEAMEALENAQRRLEQLRATKEQIEVDLHSSVDKRDAEVGELVSQAKALTTERAALVPEMPEELVALYTKITGRSQGIGVTQLEGRRCSGCRLEATVADYNSYMAAEEDQVLRCAECDRILVRS
jgi:predicted  nucleic acid-binding Zn-ribbon protein